MDPRPTIDHSAPRSVTELQLIEQHRGFPFPASYPIVASALDGLLHAVGIDALERGACHISFDSSGGRVGRVARLPLSFVASMAACAGELVLVGAEPGADRPVVLGLSPQGSVQWRTPVAVVGALALWPQPVCLDGRARLVWVTGTEASILWLAELQGELCDSAKILEFADATHELHVIAAGPGLTLVRTHGNPERLELLRVVGGKLLLRKAIPEGANPLSPTVSLVEDRYLLAWISRLDRILRLQWFNWDLSPCGPPESLVAAEGTADLRWARLIQGDRGQLAISYQTVMIGDGQVVRNDDGTIVNREPARSIEQFVAAYDGMSRSAGSFQRVVEPGIVHNTGDWIGQALLLVHGSDTVTISVYRGLSERGARSRGSEE